MTLEELAAMGYACGVETLEEALTMVELHHDSFSMEMWAALSIALEGADLTRTCADVLGPEGCAKEDAALNEVMDADKKRNSPCPT